MDVHPVVEHIRFYNEGNSYGNKDPYDLIMTVTWLNDDEIYIQGAHGNINKDRFKQVYNYYKSKGVKRIRFQRKEFIREV